MSKAEEHVSEESLALISTESFAQNVSNFRSLLLKCEKEVTANGTTGKRAGLILSEIAAMQEIITGQIAKAGKNARALGVPPEELQEIGKIYQRCLVAAAIHYLGRTDFLNSKAMDDILALIANNLNAPAEMTAFAARVGIARSTFTQIFRNPDSSSLVVPALLKIVEDLQRDWVAISARPELRFQLAAGMPPTPPTPPVGGGAGSGEGGDLAGRVARLEGAMDKLVGQTGDIRTAMARVEAKLDNVPTKADTARIEERVNHLPTRPEMYGLGIAAVLGLAGLIARVAKWI